MTDIYATNEADQQSEVDQPTNEVQIPDEVLEFVGPGKKYASLQDALKALPHAQKHISTLEGELAQLREDKGKALSQEEVYAAVQDYLKQNGGQAGSGLDETGVDALLDRKLKERERAAAEAANVNAFQSAMGKYGDMAKQKEVFESKARELEMTPEQLSAMVRTNLKAAKALFGLEGKQTPHVPPPRGLNTAALSPETTPPPRKVNTSRTSDLVAEWHRLEQEVRSKYEH